MFLRKIKDIQIINGDIAVFRQANIKAHELELQVSKYSYGGNKRIKNPLVENAVFPPFIQVFYYLFYRKLCIPAEKEFCDTYIEWLGGSNSDEFIKIEGVEYPVFDLKSRMLRAYPSLIRDLHLYYLLVESEHFTKVEYSLYTDYYEGLDIKLTYKDAVYFLSVYIKTIRGIVYKEKKTQRHDYDTYKEVRLGVEFASLKKTGEFYLLQKEHISLILELINNQIDSDRH
jgi:hypothetical protein